ncbi:hypothetical protein AMS68_007520 [Peltaster fructicola]|uniref:Dolichyldiphosphatase n=1 Tax=Peltaster fructicola TaxID=286661 RepID=A0A6H0Y4S9_9PEZI|nr:hypothetical protein AMS68_007520 [Peltaster fructicola]
MITYVAFIYSTREIEIALMFAGQMACEGLNWILKRYIQEERPTKIVGKGYGMPSSHAQFVGYFSMYLVLFLLLRHDPYKANTSTTHSPVPLWQRAGLASIIVAGAVAVAQSRIILNYHTPRQVYIGFSIGLACAVAYFIALSVARHVGLLDFLLDTSLARSLEQWIDTVDASNVLREPAVL